MTKVSPPEISRPLITVTMCHHDCVRMHACVCVCVLVAKGATTTLAQLYLLCCWYRLTWHGMAMAMAMAWQAGWSQNSQEFVGVSMSAAWCVVRTAQKYFHTHRPSLEKQQKNALANSLNTWQTRLIRGRNWVSKEACGFIRRGWKDLVQRVCLVEWILLLNKILKQF